jgi:GMP synthase PP-ATPase subunit
MSTLPPIKTPLSCQNSVTNYLRAQIGQQKKILVAVQAVLPPSLATQVKHCLIKDQVLLVYTDSAMWATQLRFYTEQLKNATADNVAAVQIKIITQQAGEVAVSHRKARLPCAEQITQLEDSARSINDEDLQQSLLKLSATLARLSERGGD